MSIQLKIKLKMTTIKKERGTFSHIYRVLGNVNLSDSQTLFSFLLSILKTIIISH